MTKPSKNCGGQRRRPKRLARWISTGRDILVGMRLARRPRARMSKRLTRPPHNLRRGPGRLAATENSRMTFSLLLQRPRTELLFDPHQQARRNAAMPHRVQQALHRHDWTCNVCGVRLPGLMEIDRLDSRGPGYDGQLAPICQFCQDLKHPLWAAAHHRLVPVALPEMNQRKFTRLCWIMLSRAPHEERGAQRLRPVIDTLARRLIQAKRTLGATHMTQAFEALFIVLDLVGTESANAIARRLDGCVRLMPAAILDPSTLCTWTGEDVVPVSRAVLHTATQQPLPPGEGEALLAEAKSLAAEDRSMGTEPLLTCACNLLQKEAAAAIYGTWAKNEAGNAACCDGEPQSLPTTRTQDPACQ